MFLLMSGRIITTNGIFCVIRGNASHRLAPPRTATHD